MQISDYRSTELEEKDMGLERRSQKTEETKQNPKRTWNYEIKLVQKQASYMKRSQMICRYKIAKKNTRNSCKKIGGNPMGGKGRCIYKLGILLFVVSFL